MAYGLEDLAAAGEDGSLILVEGETDTATLRYHGFPVLGIPGADSLKVLQAEHLKGIHTLYAWQEPDKAGAMFVQRWAVRLVTLGYQGQPKIIRLEGVEDVSELHIRDSEGFTEVLATLLDLARLRDRHPTPEQRHQRRHQLQRARGVGRPCGYHVRIP